MIITDGSTINLGYFRKADLTFSFDAEFSATDTFSLQIGEIEWNNYNFTNDGLLTFVRVDFSDLASPENELAYTVYKGEAELTSGTVTVNISGAGGAETDPIYTSDSSKLATKTYVNSAVEGLATETYVGSAVSSAVAGLASESYVSSAVAGLASQNYVQSAVVSATTGLASESYVSSAVNGLASEAYVSSAVSGLASEAFVTSAISNAGHATTGYVDSAITNVIGQIDSVLDVIIGTSSVNELVDEIMSGTSSSSSSSSAVGN